MHLAFSILQLLEDIQHKVFRVCNLHYNAIFCENAKNNYERSSGIFL